MQCIFAVVLHVALSLQPNYKFVVNITLEALTQLMTAPRAHLAQLRGNGKCRVALLQPI